HVRPHRRGEQTRRHRKIFVVRASERFAGSVGARQRRRHPDPRGHRPILMRDLVAALVALALLVAAASLATTLRMYRRRRQRARDSERALGRAVVAELPAGEDLVLFSEDAVRFYYGE